MRIATLSSLLLLCGCVMPPSKPDVELGQIDYPASQVIAGMTDGGPQYRQPLSDWDKSTCAKPKEWEKIKVYIHELQDYITNECGKAPK